MRGRTKPQTSMLAFIDPESRIPLNHPLRVIKRLEYKLLYRWFLDMNLLRLPEMARIFVAMIDADFFPGLNHGAPTSIPEATGATADRHR